MNQNRRHAIFRLLFVSVLLFIAQLYWYHNQQEHSLRVAVAKGQQMLAMVAQGGMVVDTTAVQLSITNHPEASNLLPESGALFVNALPMSMGEARAWAADGCGHLDCAYVTYYNIRDGGTINGIFDLEKNELLALWREPESRPAGSVHILSMAMDIAAADPDVQSVLGDIGDVDPAMIPMSGWLADSPCQDEWCVDLTFHDPVGSGRVFHIFINMERAEVARTFYTRGRPALDVPAPVSQRGAFSDGCHEQYGWELCWEMTAHDGINFRDATFNGDLIFSSIKITQIEAWYPSWPGGYRDEIGFSATVPPFGGTEINDFGDSFEVRQLFTEFTNWPNCICCYRYEQIIRFYADGAFEPRFVSHGPGCDDPSIYRPFWRFDVDLNGGENDEVWLWENGEWVEVKNELEIFPFVDNVSAAGEKMAIFDGELHYRWQMLRTDPLGLDEARLFVLQENEMEGEGPLLTGPGDTFQPPRQWINGDPVSGEDIVIWYVPLLKAKRIEPLWCSPDPEPGINECEAILRIAPGGDLDEPVAETAGPTATSTAVPTPTVPVTPAPTATPRPVQGDSVEDIILNSGCASCHQIGPLGEAHKVGPDLSNIGILAANRVPGLTAAEYLRQAILEPNAYITPDCPNGPCFANIMPKDYVERLTAAQVELIVDYLLQLDAVENPALGNVGENAPPLATAAPKAFPAKGNLGARGTDYSLLMVQLFLLVMVFILTLFLLWRRPTNS